MIVSSTKSQASLRKIRIDELIRMNEGNQEDAGLSIEIYFSMRPILSAVYSYIIHNFGRLSQISPSQVHSNSLNGHCFVQ
jgi:hypothetical protein